MMNRTLQLRPRLLALVVVAAFFFAAGPALASVPVSITQQGKLLDDGEPMTGGVVLEFTIYDSATGGTILWSDAVDTILNDQGVYSVTLGDDAQPIDSQLLTDTEAYLTVAVDGGEEMSPRVELTSVPFAALAETAETAETAKVAEVAESVVDGAITSDSVESIEWDKITNVPAEVTDSSGPFAELDCSSDQIALYDGAQWECSDLDFPTYSGSDFALSGEECSGSDVVTGIDASGQVICSAQEDTTYSGSDFALSDEECPAGEVVVGINNDGTPMCSSIDTEHLEDDSVTRSKLADGSVGPEELHDGVSVYTAPSGCDPQNGLVLSDECETLECSPSGCGGQGAFPEFYDCNGFCNVCAAETCDTEFVGYLVAP